MMTHLEGVYRRVRCVFSRTLWTIWLLRLPKLKKPTEDPGLVMVQIDGLALTQFNRAAEKGRIPFLNHLLHKERYVLHPFYSGLPSNTPAVQGELFYGIKGCVPAFSFVDHTIKQPIKMFDASYVEQFEPRLKEQGGPGLLTGGSAYSNIFTGGAEDAHFCFAKMGWGGVLHAVNPLVLPFLIILYIDIFLRTFILMTIEFFLALIECIRGTLKGRLFFKELEFVWLRVLVCVVLREFIVAGACMDIMRGLPIIHLNFLGYDEQAHCRGPSSRYAHWSLQGIDDAIKRISQMIHRSPCRGYDLWVYSDHGQEKTTPYLMTHGCTVEDAIQKLFGSSLVPKLFQDGHHTSSSSRAHLLGRKKGKPLLIQDRPPIPEVSGVQQVTVTAMGPLGHVYLSQPLEEQEKIFYAQKLVTELKIPLVLTREESGQVQAWTPKGSFVLPEQAAQVFGDDHPFLEEIKEDVVRVCLHPDAGQFVIAGWSKGEPSISFPIEYGAHAAMGTEETKAFALLPMDAPHKELSKTYLRPMDLRHAAQLFLKKESFYPSCVLQIDLAQARPLRLMSYNTHGCLGLDGTISAERIARVIARHNPDVVAMQELDVGRRRSRGMDQADLIAKKLEMQHHFCPAFRWQDEQYGNAILSRYPIGLIKMEALPRLGKKETRGAMWVSLEYQGTKIQIINTHLSIWPQERMVQVDALLGAGWLRHACSSGPVILCGDFNAMPRSLVYRNICRHLKDTQSMLKGHRPRRTLYGRYPLGQIDYIFVTPEFEVRSITVPRTKLDQIASDHLPLIAELIFNNQQEINFNPTG